MSLPPASIQIVPLTRGCVVLAGQSAFACTDNADILATVAGLLPSDDSLAYQAPFADAETRVPEAPPSAPPTPEPRSAIEPEASMVVQHENLLRLCDAVASGRITEDQFSELLDSACPEIPLEQVQLTRDSFSERDDGQSQLGEMLESPS